MSTRITTGKGRLSFPHLFEPHAVNPTDKPKFSTMFMFPKSDTATLERLRAAEQEAADEAKAWGNRPPKKWDSVIKDGDEDDLERWPEREGMYHFSTRSDFAPQVVDKNVQPVLDQTEVYSGVNARVSVTAFTYDYNGKKGVSFALGNVQILGGGSNLGGGAPATADFDEVEVEADEDDYADVI